jgi:pimeloyl-ACP methyl ester carboxylesterase
MIFIIIPLSIFIGILLIVFAGGLLTQRFVNTPPFTDTNGNVIQNSISEFCRVPINDDCHAVLIRGKNIDNPVLLFLHAGPCLSETGLMRNFNSELEEYYTMVYYDMRGSAKSYTPFQNYKKTFNTNQLLYDIHEMTKYLKGKLNKEKIGLMGHSFGAGFGALAAAAYPNDYSIYIGIGQASNPTEQNRKTYFWALETAKKDQNEKAISELEGAKNYWDLKDEKEYFSKMMKHKKWIAHYGGQIAGKTDFITFVLSNLTCSEYNLFDYAPYLLGMMAGGPASFDIMVSTDLKMQAANFEAPIIFLTGRQDYNLGPAIAEDYYNHIKAPLKKMYWFENSAHFPHFEEAELFQQIMIKEVLPIVQRQNNL